MFEFLTPDCRKEAGVVRRWWLGFSGGLDSHVLLHLAVAAKLNQTHNLTAIHVDHNLQPEAGVWVEHCSAVCENLGVPLQVLKVAVDEGASLEAQARQARYQAFEHLMSDGDGLLLAHHADDQAETILLRLMRGSGVRGLSSIPEQRPLGKGRLFRPLLSLPRWELEQYAEQNQLNWIEDPSNSSLDFDRNYVRHQVLPELLQRWPHAVQALGRSVRFCAEAQSLNQQLAAEDLQRCSAVKSNTDHAGRGLDYNGMLSLSRDRQCNLLRFWISDQAESLPEEPQLLRILDEVITAREDAQPMVCWGHYQIRRYQGQLYLTDNRWQLPKGKVDWDLTGFRIGKGDQNNALNSGLDFEFPFGTLSAQRDDGRGIPLKMLGSVEIGFRQGGERLVIAGRQGSRSLKKLLQEAGVPPWQRSFIPLIFVDGVLAAVAGFWIVEGFQADQNQEALGFSWKPEL
ncbi:tRNA lysidine(34) synthetase TilS [Motiliproteus sp. MSK22-1]|nr:tRNA lysidine(34) synthetase TilS [Motiliproteus sp. MSK22-1]